MFFSWLWTAFLAAAVYAAPESDLVDGLPGVSFEVNFKQYAGQLNASSDTYEHYYQYWLLESQSDPSKDPLVIWLQGGPGCSSIGGQFEEVGPFRVNPDGETLFENPFSWNKAANLLHMESPNGVGFSFSMNNNDTTSDDQTAGDNYRALIDFFAKFPEYKKRDFYITGESYGGVYIPTLAKLIVDGIKSGEFSGTLKAYVFSSYDVQHTANDGYNLYQDCYKGDAEVTFDGQKSIGGYKLPALDYVKKDVPDTARLIDYDSTDHIAGYPCFQDDATPKYLNQDKVKRALHVSTKVIDRKWTDCNSALNSDEYYRTHFDQLPELQHVLETQADVRILIYNGDTDLVCNFLGDSWFALRLTNHAGLQRKIARSEWWYRGQIAGYRERFERLDIVTVKGAGHFVPLDRAGPALQMLTNFIEGNDYSEKLPPRKLQPLNMHYSSGSLPFQSVGFLCLLVVFSILL